MPESQTTNLDLELKALNAEVEAVIAKRKAWMDAHMADYAKFKIGENIYDLGTGRKLGTISKLYRYWGDRDSRYDTSMSIEYEFHTGRNSYDNTSRHGGCLSFGSADDLVLRKESDLRWAKLMAGTKND